MKRLTLSLFFTLTSFSVFAAWHKAALYYNNGSVTTSEIKLPEETFSGFFKRSILVKDGENENYVNINAISKVVMGNGITFIKYDNNGKPVLLEQVTKYDDVNILVLPSVYSENYIAVDRYIYRQGGSQTFENMPIPVGRDITASADNAGFGTARNAINELNANPVGLYYSSITRNGVLYTPASKDYIYLMKGDKIERLQSVRTYATLNKFMGDDETVAKYLKNGLSSFYELNSVVALYNAKAGLKTN